VIGYGHSAHVQPLQPVIDFRGMVIGLPANAIQPGCGKHSRCDGVNAKVAAHGAIVRIRYEQPVKSGEICVNVPMELIEHKIGYSLIHMAWRVLWMRGPNLWHNRRNEKNSRRLHDGGGGHRNAAVALQT